MVRFAGLDKYNQALIVGAVLAIVGGVVGKLAFPIVHQLQPGTTDSVAQAVILSGLLGFIVGGSVFLFYRERIAR